MLSADGDHQMSKRVYEIVPQNIHVIISLLPNNWLLRQNRTLRGRDGVGWGGVGRGYSRRVVYVK